MAVFEVNEGPPGQGKSLYQARLFGRLIKRNKKWYATLVQTFPVRHAAWVTASEAVKSATTKEAHNKWCRSNPEPKEPRKREIWSNQRFAPDVEDEAEGYLRYWLNLQDLTKLRHVDIIWDEVATDLDARNWPLLSDDVKRFLSQYRKRGLEIYGNTQDFSMVDQRARLMITGVSTLTKIIGSSDISETRPAPKHIWGIVMIRQVLNYRETNPEKKEYEIVPTFMLITRELTEMYDTTQDIEASEPTRLKHKVVYCEHYGEKDPVTGRMHDCQFHKVIHS